MNSSEPHIERAARAYLVMREAYHENGPGKVGDQQKAYCEATDAACRAEGLSLQHVDYEGRLVKESDPDGYSEYGTHRERLEILRRVALRAVDLQIIDARRAAGKPVNVRL